MIAPGGGASPGGSPTLFESPADRRASALAWAVALTAAMVVATIVLLASYRLQRVLGDRGMVAVERLMGLEDLIVLDKHDLTGDTVVLAGATLQDRPAAVALATAAFGGGPVDPDCVAGAEASAKLCEELGLVVE